MSDVIDLKEFLERVQDDKDLLKELLDIYREDYLTKRVSLESAIKINNYEEVKSIAHSLKGASGNISAKALRETFMKLEEMGKNKNLTGAEALLPVVDQQYGDLSKRIDQLKIEL